MPSISDIRVLDSSGQEVTKPFLAGEGILVVLEGDTNMKARFKITGLMDEFAEMTETSVLGVYQGTYIVQQDDDRVGIQVTGNLITQDEENAAVPLTKDFSEVVIDTGTPEIEKAFFTVKDRQNDGSFGEMLPYVVYPYYPYYEEGSSAEKPLNRFDRIEATLKGEAGLEAFFSITNVANNIPMEETSEPGLYKGEYIVQHGDNAVECQVVCFLRDEAQNLNSKTAIGSFDIDTIYPNLEAYGHNLTGDASVVAGETIEVFIQGESGLTAYFNFVLDYENHSEDFLSTGQENVNMFEEEAGKYTGRYTVLENDSVHNGRIKIYVEDKAGNLTDILVPIWVNIRTIKPEISSFVVQTFSEGSEFVFPLPESNEEVQGPINVNKLVVVIVEGEVNRSATFSIEGVVNAQDLVMTEYDDGLYLGSYTVQEGDNTLEAPVTCRLVDEAGNQNTKVAEKKLTIDTTIPVVNDIVMRPVANQPTLRKIEIDVTF